MYSGYSQSAFSGTQITGQDNLDMSFNANESSSKPRLPSIEKSLRPLTIKSILNAPEPMHEAGLVIDGQEVTHLSVCAQVMSVSEQSAFVTYEINDGTGDISCKVWSNSNDDRGSNSNGNAAAVSSSISADDYVRVFGRVNMYQGTRSVNVFRISRVQDMNELTLHNLEVIHAHLANAYMQKKMMGGAEAGSGASSLNTSMNQHQAGSVFDPSRDNSLSYANGHRSGNASGSNDNLDSTGINNINAAVPENKLQSRILAVIKRNDSGDEGCNVTRVFEALNEVEIDDIRTAIEEMAASGLMYSTVDEDCYKAT